MSSVPDVPIQPATKVCTKCGERKSETDYYVKEKTTGRRYSWCKVCHIALTSARYVPSRPKPSGPPAYKYCPKCDRTLWASEFHVRTKETGELRSWCKDCRSVEKAAYQEAHRDDIRAKSRAAYAANPEVAAERQRVYALAHPERYRKLRSDWKAANKDAVNASTHKRRATIKGNGGHWTATEWQAIKAAQGYRCLLCQRQEPDITLCFDHVIPVSLGGPNTAENGQGLCRSCNSTKHRKILDLREGMIHG